jgi:hypothetical protein
MTSLPKPMPLTLEQFAPLVGQEFRILEDCAGVKAMTLIDARHLNAPDFAGRQPFSLLFEAPPDMPAQQRIYALRHSSFEALDIFLVPIARTPAGIRLEAIFN